MDGARPSRWRLGEVLFDQADGAVWRDGRRIDLSPKLLGILNALVAAAPRGVTKEQLLDTVWPEAVVGEAALAQRVKELRRLLGDDARQPRYIETVARRGYRLKVPALRQEDDGAGVADETSESSRFGSTGSVSGAPSLLRWSAGALAVLAVTLGWLVVRDSWQSSLPKAPPASVEPSPFTPRRAVGVAVAVRAGSEPGGEWVGPVIAEVLTAELGAGGLLRTVSPGRLAEAARELGYGELPPRDATPRLRQLLGVDLLVVGRYSVGGAGTGESLDLWLEVRNAKDGTPLAVVTDRAALFGLGDLAASVGPRLRSACGVGEPSPPPEPRLQVAFPVGTEAARSYGEGLAAMRGFDFPRAIAALEAAARVEGDAVAVRLALAQALQWSGQRERAKSELRMCLSEAGALPRELQLVIEADYRQLNGEWERAVEINRSLHVLHPDNLDYGLSLATLLASHGDESAAEATLDELRALPAPLGLDPRIDLARAWMHESDLTAKLATAARAAERANALGARLLLAAARIQQGRALRGLGKPQEALAAFEEAWRLREQAGDASGVGKALRHVALIERDEGHLVPARAHLEQATTLFRRIGDVEQLVETLREQAGLAVDMGRVDDAAALLAEVDGAPPEVVRGGAVALAALERARLVLVTGSASAAVAAARAAVAVGRADSLTVAEARAEALLALALLHAGELRAAAEASTVAETLAAATDDRAVRLEVATAAAMVARGGGGCGAARFALQRALREGANAPVRLRLDAETVLAECAALGQEPGSSQRLAQLDAEARRWGFPPPMARLRSAPWS